ncbi:winged helix-turn-helix domain-containing protein [Nitratireductor sp. XY-223]|nr:winged helix-turn-helix domain-containing protein [Nitratireductor sp. XY-223]
MRRLGFEYKKPLALCAQADPEQQQAFVDWYDALMTVRHDGAKRRI